MTAAGDQGTILVVFHEATVGGASRSVLRAVPHLQELGWRVVFWVDRPSEMYDELAAAGYEVDGVRRAVGYSRNWLRRAPDGPRKVLDTPAWFRGFVRHARAVRPDVVHANSAYTLPEGLLARAMRIPVLYHVHEIFPDNWKAGLARGVVRAAGVTPAAVSAASVAALAGGSGLRPATIHESTVFPPTAADRPAAPRPVVVGHVGWIGRRKGTDVFLDAARRTLAVRDDVEFRLIGPYVRESPEWPWIERVLADVEPSGVRYLGRTDAVEEMRDWDVVVQPSRWDPFPLVVLEAMANGLPVVGTAVDGIAEQVLDGTTGLLVPDEDAAGLAAAIGRLADDHDLRRDMGAAGRERVRTAFTAEHQARALDAVYREAIARRRGGR